VGRVPKFCPSQTMGGKCNRAEPVFASSGDGRDGQEKTIVGLEKEGLSSGLQMKKKGRRMGRRLTVWRGGGEKGNA